jgi:hypothetical protein
MIKNQKIPNKRICGGERIGKFTVEGRRTQRKEK